LVIVRTGAQALIRALGPRKGRKFVKEWTALLSTENSVKMLFPSQPQEDRAAVSAVQQQALAWMREALPVFMASIPPE
jgi:hypothetical protein